MESEKEESIPEEGGRKEEMTGVKDVEGVEEGEEEEKVEESGRRLMSEGRNSQRKGIESDDRWDSVKYKCFQGGACEEESGMKLKDESYI